MTEHPPRKEYRRSREKQSAVSNYVSQIVRSELGQGQERQHLNMTHIKYQCGTGQKKSTAMVTSSRKRSKNPSQ